MKNLIFCYPKCSTCKKAIDWLEENNIKYEYRDIKQENPGIEEIRQYHKKTNLPLKRFFNTSGLIYRELGLKDKLNEMTEEEMITLLSTDGMLVKRPVFITDTNVLIGFKESEWKETLINI
ncbi:arsenate reductase family protein [Proteocatella sphenisci]|uniref:arsenate reductase family protein n=1 Tax=Proteocatella sphenisci TaxID=181070 RepID=UPI00048EE92A|nr:arsenate reductase family protein [Proteocatella sphenisci]